MDTNEKSNNFRGLTDRYSSSIKLVVVAFLTLLLLIPLNMVSGLISDRQRTKSSAILDITSKWGSSQTITGPCLVVPYTETLTENGKESVVKKNMLLLPENLLVDGNVVVESRKRGIYDASVYKSDLKLSGTFLMAEIDKAGLKPEQMLLDETRMIISLSDLKGIAAGIILQMNNKDYTFAPGLSSENLSVGTVNIQDIRTQDMIKYNYGSGTENQIFAVGLNAKLDSMSANYTDSEEVPFSLTLQLNGSQGLYVVPIGRRTTVKLTSNWGTPSFSGEFLPETRDVTDDGFNAEWKVLDLNRSYGQHVLATNQKDVDLMASSRFGVHFIQAVDQYQQNMRSIKYAILIILLTFVAVFFIELSRRHSAINPFQYLLVGLALILFYTLLLSMSEVWGFNLAYIVAAVMTIVLITLHMGSVLKNRKMGLIIGGVLTFLYLFIFILIQMESYALLFGSLMLFAILAVIMYYSKRLKF